MKKSFTNRTLLSILFVLLISGNAWAAVGDAGVSGIPVPTSPVCRGISPVSVIIKNYGAITISTISVNWKVNGVAQTPYSFTGNITAGNEDTVDIGTFNFVSSADTIVAWTSNPNGSADSDQSNDSTTSIVSVSSKLTGTYTIGGTLPDYANITAAVNALTTNGVCGAVVFNMRADTDTVKINIPQIVGASATNTITFQSENGDSTSVILTSPSLDTLADNYLISLNGADYFTFRGLTLQRSGINANARVVVFTDTATHNTITHCRILGAPTSLPNSLAALLYSTSGTTSNDSSNTFTYNLLKDGSIGIYMNGNSSLSLEQYTVIRNNTFINQYFKGIQMSNQGNAIIEDNTFNTNSTYTGYSAIYLDRSLRPHSIRRNQILDTPGTGIFLLDCTAQAGVHGIIANNFIHSNDSAGISVVNGDYQDIIFNSILMTGTTNTFSALFMRGSGVGKKVVNNILANSGGGYAYVVSDSAVFGILSSNYNNLYTTGSNVGEYNGINQATLANWKTASQRDTNSLAVNPNFATTSDLHVTAIAMDDRGTPIAAITTDIDGQTRSTLTPDIGADEYASVSRNVGITGMLSPTDSTCGNAAATVTVIVSNTGGFPEANFDLHSSITGSLTTTLNYTYTATIAPGTSDTITFATTINTSAGGTFNFKNYTSLSVDDVHANDTLFATITHFAPSPAPTGTNDTICGSGSGVLTATSPDSIAWYSASTGGTLLGTGASFTTPSVSSTTPFYASANGGCEGPRVAVTVVVQPTPNVTLGNDTTINLGDSISLNAGGGFITYLWSTGATTPSIWVNSDGCYAVTVTNSAGCQDVDTVCVDVISPFDVGVTMITSPSNMDCANDTIQLIVQVSNLGFNNATDIPVRIQVSGAVTANFADTIQATLTPGMDTLINMGMINMNAGGVITLRAYTYYVNDVDQLNDTLVNVDTIVVPPNPPAAIGASRCGVGTIVLIGSASDSVYWYTAPSGGSLLFIGDNYVINGLTTTTTYYIQTGDYCNSQVRVPITATIHNPVVNLGNDTTATDSLVLNAGSGFASYTWSDNSTGQTLTVTTSNFYSVCITDSFGCNACDTINVSIINGIETVSANANINLYPNPTRNAFTVAFKNKMSEKVSFVLSNLQGQIILNEEAENVDTKTFNVSQFAKGVYNLHIRTENSVSVYRLIIE